MTKISRRKVLAGLTGGSIVALAGCGSPSEEEMHCEGDCHLVKDWGVSTDTSFGTNKTEVSVAFKEPFTGTVSVRIYSGSDGDMKGADSRRLKDQRATSFEFNGAWTGETYLTVEENESH